MTLDEIIVKEERREVVSPQDAEWLIAALATKAAQLTLQPISVQSENISTILKDAERLRERS